MTDGDTERGRGILSPADRDFLRSEPEDYSRQARHAREQAIRERVRNALLDVPILVDHLGDDLLHDALTPEDGADPVAALPELVSFLYQYYGSEYQLERLIADGVERVRREQGDPVKARVSIDLFPDELAELEQRLEEDGVDAVDHRELEELWDAGYLTDDEYLTLVERWQDRWEPDRVDDVDGEHDVAEFDHGDRRQVVHGAVNRAKRNVDMAQRREESREEWLANQGVDDREDGAGDE